MTTGHDSVTAAQGRVEVDSRAPRYWMRSLSFLAAHRIISTLNSFPQGLRANELNRVIIENEILHRCGRPPKPTTLYHYRTMLLRLGVVARRGLKLCIKSGDYTVAALLGNPPPDGNNAVLDYAAKDHFATLVLRNKDCLTSFFGRFLASTTTISVSDFRYRGVPVKYRLQYTADSVDIRFENCATGKVTQIRSTRTRKGSPPMVQAIPYGMRYWARNELSLIDEYCRHDDGSIVMFPILQFSPRELALAARKTARQILSMRTLGEWTVLSIRDLIVRCCEQRRQPIAVLFRAIDILMDECRQFIVLIPTPKNLATITALSPGREKMELRQYYRYRKSHGPYISHIRIHRGAKLL